MSGKMGPFFCRLKTKTQAILNKDRTFRCNWTQVLLCFLLLNFWAQAHEDIGEALTGADQVLMEAPGLASFLGDEARRERYYRLISAYYGGVKALERPSFDKLLEQLTKVLVVAPELEGRLLEPLIDQAPLYIESELETFGRVLHFENWNHFLNDRLDLMAKAASEFIAVSDGVLSNKVNEWLASVVKRKSEFLAQSESPPTVAKNSLRNFTDIILEDEILGQLTHALMYRLFTGEDVQGYLRSIDADLILNLFKDWREAVEQRQSLVLPAGIDLSSEAAVFLFARMRRELPKLERLLSDLSLFPYDRVVSHGKSTRISATKKSIIRSRSPMRAFHAIFVGAVLGECIAGRIQSLTSAHPARWARVAAKGAILQFIEVNGKYNGSIQLTPVKKRYSVRNYLSIDTAAPVLARKVVLTNHSPAARFGARAEQKYSAMVFDSWIHSTVSQLSHPSAGIVLGRGFGGDNARVLEKILSRNSYFFGKDAGPAHEFIIDDPLAKKIAASLPVLGNASSYVRDTFVINATLPIQTNLMRLAAVHPRHAQTLSEAYILKLLKGTALDSARALEWLRLNPSQWTPKIWTALVPLVYDLRSGANAVALLSGLLVPLKKWPTPFWTALTSALRDPNQLLVIRVFDLLKSRKNSRPPEINQKIFELMTDSRDEVRQAAFTDFWERPRWNAIEWDQVIILLKHPQAEVRKSAVMMLGSKEVWPLPVWITLKDLLEDPVPSVRSSLGWTLTRKKLWHAVFWKNSPEVLIGAISIGAAYRMLSTHPQWRKLYDDACAIKGGPVNLSLLSTYKEMLLASATLFSAEDECAEAL